MPPLKDGCHAGAKVILAVLRPYHGYIFGGGHGAIARERCKPGDGRLHRAVAANGSPGEDSRRGVGTRIFATTARPESSWRTTLGKEALRSRDTVSDTHRDRLFLLSVIALTTAGMTFGLRGYVMADMAKAFGLDSAKVGWAVGGEFLAFAISVFIGSPLCDYLGMGRLLGLSCASFIVGLGMIVSAPHFITPGTGTALALLYASWFVAGLGRGLVEAVINPLVATLYPDEKTHKLNVLHAWWPGGIIIGGVTAYLLRSLPWEARLATFAIPALIFGYMLIGEKFPPTERVQAGVSAGEMIREAFKPLFIVWFLMMFLTAGMELAPGQWVEAMLTRMVHFHGIWILIYGSALMFVFRHFAGPLAHKFSPVGLMWLSSLLAGLGLLAISFANSPVTALVAATIWYVGVCYMWPTMLGVTSERFPRGGALLIGLMGCAGNLSIQFVLPLMGSVYDSYTQKYLGAIKLSDAVSQSATNPAIAKALDAARLQAAPWAFRYVASFGIVLIVVFGIIWLMDKAKGGYKQVKLT